jgi:saccharopine dehydrogenase-like NADP-dependent oxidoreductase
MTDALVLGAGMVGSVIAADLAADPSFRVTVADRSDEALKAASRRASRLGATVRTVVADLGDRAVLREQLAGADIVLGALASRLGFETLRTVIEAGKPYCDISFMSEDAWELDELARSKGVTAVVDFGVAPGMSHVLVARGVSRLTECRSVAIYVGGLPREPRWPFHYKAPFAPTDVIEEYRRPARLVEHGEVVVREPLSEPEWLDIPGVGTLEAFNTDGLRSLTRAMKIPFMKEKTLRYPEHAQLMRTLQDTGFFGDEPIRVGDVSVRPVDVLSALVLPKWAYQEGEEDLTALRVVVEGTAEGEPTRLVWDLLDAYDRDTGTSSMARTTGFPCALMARELAAGRFDRPGVVTPELVGEDEALVERLLTGLAQRGVVFELSEV